LTSKGFAATKRSAASARSGSRKGTSRRTISIRDAHLSPLTEGEKKHIKPEDAPASACPAPLRSTAISRCSCLNVRAPASRCAQGRQGTFDQARPRGEEIQRGPGAADAPRHDHGRLERVLKFLEDDYGLKGLTFDYLVLKDLQDILRKGEWKPRSRSGWTRRSSRPNRDSSSSVMARRGHRHDDLRGLPHGPQHGQGGEHESMMNPQVPYGEDVMSRITTP